MTISTNFVCCSYRIFRPITNVITLARPSANAATYIPMTAHASSLTPESRPSVRPSVGPASSYACVCIILLPRFLADIDIVYRAAAWYYAAGTYECWLFVYSCRENWTASARRWHSMSFLRDSTQSAVYCYDKASVCLSVALRYRGHIG